MRNAILSAAVAISLSVPASARENQKATMTTYDGPPRELALVLDWVARQDRVAAAAGVPSRQLYVYNSDRPDYFLFVVTMPTTAAQDAAIAAAGRKMRIETGPRALARLHAQVHHVDTTAHGPTNAASLLRRLGSLGTAGQH